MTQNSVDYDIFNVDLDLLDDHDDSDSLFALTDADTHAPIPERILAELPGPKKLGREFETWYLVKWEACPLLRSSWEDTEFCRRWPELLVAWQQEQVRQAAGESEPLNLEEFKKAWELLDTLERTHLTLRRFKNQISWFVTAVSD